ncbi:MAG TPA: HEAT repeat domain-containing protein, partial [bacterium]|nr:HEAT repeat domain-containing protein [bacterium]
LDATVASLIEVLDDPNKPEEEKMRACSILSHIGGPTSIQALIGAFATFGYDGFLIFYIGLLIQTFGDEATQPLIAGLRDENPSVREWSANLLGRIDKAEALAPLFSASSNEKNKWVETTMKRALEDLEDSLDRRDTGLIFEDLKSGNPKKRRRAAKRLGKIGNPRCIDALIRALSDENGEVRGQAFSSLVHMRLDAHLESRKPNHPGIDEALRTALNNEDNATIRAFMVQMLEALYG